MNRTLIEKLFNASMELLIVFDEAGRLILMNETGKEALGYQSIEGLNIDKILAPLFQGEKSFKEKLEEIEGKKIDTVIYRSDLTCFHATIRLVSELVEADTKQYAVWIYDLQTTQELMERLKEAENKVKDKMKSRNEFVANITHELRTPVNGIKGHIYNLLTDEMERDKKKTLEIVFKCCENMEKLINHIMDFSKIEAGKIELDPVPFSIRECVQHAVETNICNANAKGIQLSSYVADNIPDQLLGDELRIGQILNNLISNAVKFTAIGSVRVEVYCTLQKEKELEITFLVLDTGIGISKEDQAKLFKIFSQVDGTITRRYGGTGLGLYVSKQLVELMGGHIDVESEVGKGTTFQVSILLPLAEQTVITERLNKKAVTVEDLKKRIKKYQTQENLDSTYVFNSEENRSAINSTIEKLFLAVEMDNWPKAEQFADNLKKLCEGAPDEIQKCLFRMIMQLRKEAHEKAIAALKKVREQLEVVKI